MEEPLKCLSLLSLEKMAVMKLIAILWNGSDILASVTQFRDQNNAEEEWRTIVDMVKNKIMSLESPELLKKKMVDAARHIGLEIRNWMHFHEQTFSLSCIEIFEQNSARFCFAKEATVDHRRKAQEIVRCDRINVVTRYVVACSYWLEDHIPFLWQKLPEEDRRKFYEGNPAFQGLEFSWPRIFRDGQSNLDSYLRRLDRNLTSFNQRAFEHSAKKGNKATAEYFFRKLLPGERGDSLMRSACAVSEARIAQNHGWVRFRNVLHYLLSLMTPEQQIVIIKKYPVQVISCFLDWPRRELFSENAGLIWPFLPQHGNEYLLTELKRFDASNFPEFFKLIPLDFKQYIVGPNPICRRFSTNLLVACLDSKDSDSIVSMFRSADVAGRERLVFDEKVLRLFHDSLARGDWRLVEVCLREATLSEEQRRRLKGEFLRCLERGFLRGAESDVPIMSDGDPKLENFFSFLDGTDTSTEEEQRGQKRKLERRSSE